MTAKVGDKVLYPTSTSPEVAEVVWGPEWVSDDVGGLPVCAGRATQEDDRRDEAILDGRGALLVVRKACEKVLHIGCSLC